LSVAVQNAVGALHERCDYVTGAPGGLGAVREVCDLLLDARAREGK
jgi:3-deoxy-D-manno-octulosonate 8-phosphate phosphatase KdsC-like HAD superfamily phosphatase